MKKIIVMFLLMVFTVSSGERAKPLPMEETEPYEVTIIYPVPLDQNLQAHVLRICEEREIDPCIIFAQIAIESNFKADAMGDNGRSFGLMQIWQDCHLDRMERLGVTNLLDPYQNVTVGIDLMSELLGWGKGLDYALSYYSGSSGEYSPYAERVKQLAQEINEGAMTNVKEGSNRTIANDDL